MSIPCVGRDWVDKEIRHLEIWRVYPLSPVWQNQQRTFFVISSDMRWLSKHFERFLPCCLGMRKSDLILPVNKNLLPFLNPFLDKFVAFIKMLQQKFPLIVCNGKYFMCKSLNQRYKIRNGLNHTSGKCSLQNGSSTHSDATLKFWSCNYIRRIPQHSSNF